MPRRKETPTPEAMETGGNMEGVESMDVKENLEGADAMDYENMMSGENTLNEDDVMEFANNEVDEKLYIDTPLGTGQRQRRTQAEPTASILTLEVGAEVETQEDKENAIWHEIKNSHVTGTHLTGNLSKIERLENGLLIAIANYKGQRVAIPMNEMMLGIKRPAGQSDDEYNERAMRVLNRMMGAEIDFVVRGITGKGNERATVASRKAAMLRLRRRYYLNTGANGKPQVYQGRIVEARIVAVSQFAIRIEIFGAETSIRNRDISWGYAGDCRDMYFVGDSV